LFGAPNIGQYSVRLRDRCGLFERVDNRLDRNARDHEIGVFGPFENIIGRHVDSPASKGRLQSRHRSPDTDYLLRQTSSMECQPNGSSQQSNAYDANPLPNHENSMTLESDG
jgi:hypothetical protein